MLTMAIPDAEILAVRVFAIMVLIRHYGTSVSRGEEFKGIGSLSRVESSRIVFSYGALPIHYLLVQTLLL